MGGPVEQVRANHSLEMAALLHGSSFARCPPSRVVASDLPPAAMEHVGYDLAKTALEVAGLVALLLEQGCEFGEGSKRK